MSILLEVWSQWHTAFHNDLSASERLSLLESLVSPDFIYTNMNEAVPVGDLKQVASMMEQVAHQQDKKKLISRHVQWLEQHNQTALQWEVVDGETGTVALKGWSYAYYTSSQGGETGSLKLKSVADFWG